MLDRTQGRGRGGRIATVFVALFLAAGGLTSCSKVPTQDLGATNGPVTIPAAPSSSAAAATRSTSSVKPTWWSGASGDRAANGSYGKWRGAPVAIGGTWDNGDAEQVLMVSICPGGTWARWTKPLDVAVGAIERSKGETWARAAAGAYDARWTKNLQRIKSCWGARDAGLLYIRFAHEMNLTDMDWYVKGGEEADFVKAITRYSDLRYKIIPNAHIVLCPSDGMDGRLEGLDIHKLWPAKDAQGRQVADIYAIDTYNGFKIVHDAEEFAAKANSELYGNPWGIERHRQLAEMWGVPFAVSEWSNNGDPKDVGKGGEEPAYVKAMNDYFRSYAGDMKHPKPGQLIYEIQYNLEPHFQFFPTRIQPKTAAMYRSLSWGH